MPRIIGYLLLIAFFATLIDKSCNKTYVYTSRVVVETVVNDYWLEDDSIKGGRFFMIPYKEDTITLSIPNSVLFAYLKNELTLAPELKIRVEELEGKPYNLLVIQEKENRWDQDCRKLRLGKTYFYYNEGWVMPSD